MSNSATPWTATSQASLPFTITWSLLKLMSIELVMLFSHLILCHPLLLLPSVFLSIRVFSRELAFCIKWPKYWSFSIFHMWTLKRNDTGELNFQSSALLNTLHVNFSEYEYYVYKIQLYSCFLHK